MSFEPVLRVQARLGEGPVWSQEQGALFFVDIKGRRLHRFEPATNAHSGWDLPEEIGCIGLAKGGGFVAGLRSGIWLLDAEARPVRMLAANPEDQTISRFNDGKVDPAGRFLAGTLDEAKKERAAHFYRYDRRGLAVLASGILTSNGTAFSPDGRTLYHSDTPAFTVWRRAYDPATGEAGEREVFVKLASDTDDRGRPDGAAVDAEGHYWSAMYEGGRIHRYAPDGSLVASYPVPARCPTMVAFGGADLKTVYVTSARDGRPPEELTATPGAGDVFAMRTDVPGLPATLFDPDV